MGLGRGVKRKVLVALLGSALLLTVSCKTTEVQDQVEREVSVGVESNVSEVVEVVEVVPTEETVEIEEVEVLPVEETVPSSFFEGREIIEVAGGDQSGKRQAMVAVDIGFGDREYWAFTNEYGQLIKVIASEIVLQDDATEKVLSTGRYYHDEAKVPGVESPTLDEGHVIADSLGGVSNAYNITPQDSTLNRHGDQAYMEKVIRTAGGCTDFEADITYSDTKTQIPNSYTYMYKINGEIIQDTFKNVNPDEYNKDMLNSTETATETIEEGTDVLEVDKDLSKVDTNGNGKVTIAEAKSAGYEMPIYSDHWLYPYMQDRDSDGVVGE